MSKKTKQIAIDEPIEAEQKNQNQNQNQNQNAEDEGHKVFLGNVAYDATEEELIALLKNQPGFLEAKIARYGGSNKTRGFGYVSFETQEQADGLIGNDQIMLNGRTLRFTKYEKNSSKNKTTRAFIRGLSKETSNDALIAFFKKYGTVNQVVLHTNRETGENKGTGFVEFSTPDECNKLVSSGQVKIEDNGVQNDLTVSFFRKKQRNNRQNHRRNNQNRNGGNLGNKVQAAYNEGFEAGREYARKNASN